MYVGARHSCVSMLLNLLFTGQILDMNEEKVAAVTKVFVREQFGDLADAFVYPSTLNGRCLLSCNNENVLRLMLFSSFSISSIPRHPELDSVCKRFYEWLIRLDGYPPAEEMDHESIRERGKLRTAV